jgi:hypothetical protein
MAATKNIDEITRSLTTLTGNERMVGRDSGGDFKALLSNLIKNVPVNFSVGTSKFQVDAATGDTNIAGNTWTLGNFAVGPLTKFTVAAATGNTVVAGTHDVTGNLRVNTDRFVVTAATGSTKSEGWSYATSGFAAGPYPDVTLTIAGSTGNSWTAGNWIIDGNLTVETDIEIGDNKFTVAGATGNTAIAGTLTVTSDFSAGAAGGNALLGADDTDNIVNFGSGAYYIEDDTIIGFGEPLFYAYRNMSTLGYITGPVGAFVSADFSDVENPIVSFIEQDGMILAAGDFLIGDLTDWEVPIGKFTVAAATGNTAIAGTLGVTGVSNLTGGIAAGASNNKFTVAAATGNTYIEGTVGIGTSSPDTKFHVYTGSAGAVSALSGSVITSEASGNNYLQFLSPNTAFQAILFGDVDNNVAGQIAYSHATNYLGFHVNVSERMRIDTSGNVKIAGTADRATTAGSAHLDIFNGTAPVGTLANGISLYSSSGECYVMDAAGNATLLSPHDKEGNWIYRSKDTVTGKVLRIDMEKFMKFLNDKFGTDFIHEYMEA